MTVKTNMNLNNLLFILLPIIAYSQETDSIETSTTPILINYNPDKDEKFFTNFLYAFTIVNVLWLVFTVHIGILTVLVYKRIRDNAEEKKKEDYGTSDTIPHIAQYNYHNMTYEDRQDMRKFLKKTEQDDNMKAGLKEVEEESAMDKTPTKKKSEFIAKRQKTEKQYVTESQFQNEGSINFRTQFTVQSDIVINLKKEEKGKKIDKVKWANGPIKFYEIGFGVDQVEMPTPSEKGSSSITTAQIEKLPPK